MSLIRQMFFLLLNSSIGSSLQIINSRRTGSIMTARPERPKMEISSIVSEMAADLSGFDGKPRYRRPINLVRYHIKMVFRERELGFQVGLSSQCGGQAPLNAMYSTSPGT